MPDLTLPAILAGGAVAASAFITGLVEVIKRLVPVIGRHHVLHRVPGGSDVTYGAFLDLQMDLPDGLVHLVQMPIGEGGGAVRAGEQHLLIAVVEGRAFEIPRPAFRQPEGFGTEG